MNERDWKDWNRNGAKWLAPSPLARPDGEADLPPECAAHAPLLTALFDGEATPAQSQSARRHLLRCERCAQTWLGWNQTRALLLDQKVPPTPPALLEGLRALCGLSTRPTPDLHAHILARTSRAHMPRETFSGRENLPPAPIYSSPTLAARILSARVSTSSATAWSAMALAAFVLLATRDSLLPAHPVAPPENSVSPSVPAPTFAQSRANAEAEILPIRTVALPSTPSARSDALASSTSSAERTLELAQRETTKLAANQEASASSSPELPPLAPQVVLASFPTSRAARAPRKHRRAFSSPSRETRREPLAPRASTSRALAPRPLLLASTSVAPTSELAPLPSPSVETASDRSELPRGILLASASLERAPLRISTPRIRPLTFNRESARDDVGIDDLDSTVREYRATLSEDTDNGG